MFNSFFVLGWFLSNARWKIWMNFSNWKGNFKSWKFPTKAIKRCPELLGQKCYSKALFGAISLVASLKEHHLINPLNVVRWIFISIAMLFGAARWTLFGERYSVSVTQWTASNESHSTPFKSNEFGERTLVHILMRRRFQLFEKCITQAANWVSRAAMFVDIINGARCGRLKALLKRVSSSKRFIKDAWFE